MMATGARADEIVTRWRTAQAAIGQATRAADRAPDDVRLVAVSKTFPAGDIAPLIAAGQRIFGENRVQEAKAKWPMLKAAHPELELHLIGPLQSNKAREAVELFDVIETVDRPKIAKALADAMRYSGRRPRLLVQINTGAEPQKAGVRPAEADSFLEHCREIGLKIEGLMCIPPVQDQASPHFALLAKIARRHGLAVRSMGMSADFELAIQLGATHVRIGSAIFGSR